MRHDGAAMALLRRRYRQMSGSPMPRLLHFTLDPYARRIRLSLAAYAVETEYLEERPWQPSQTLLELNPSGLSPVFVEDGGLPVCGAEALTEYLEETRGGEVSLLPGSALERAEIRRLVAWFDVKFYTEVTEPVLVEVMRSCNSPISEASVG